MPGSLPLYPVWLTDVIGSALMIVFACLSVWYAAKLCKLQNSNVIWTYLLWFTLGLAGFALSRGVGHIAKRLLLMADMQDYWIALRPYSGSFNTLAFMVVASITLFFHRVHQINKAILEDKKAIMMTGEEVMRLNRDLETLVIYRTEELSRSEKKYRRIFEASMDVIFILDRNGYFLDLNQAGLTTLGYDKDKIIGILKLRDLFPNQADGMAIMNDLDSNMFIKDRECTVLAANGSDVNLLLSGTAGVNENGEIVGYEGIAKDITARVSMETQLQQADKLASLGQISTGIAHEINNPLGVMLGYTQLLLREQELGSQLHDDLKTIEKHARNCKTIVEDLLKFARGTKTEKVSMNVNDCIQETISLLSHQFDLDNIEIKTSFESDIPEIVGDGEKLKQVFMNLLMNGKQAIQDKGTIAVSTDFDSERNCIRIVVSDNGSGISRENLTKIFDPFYTTKPIGEGTGLGLSVSYGIVQDHNGRIEVKSKIGKGSDFTVLLPVKDSSGQPCSVTTQDSVCP